MHCVNPGQLMTLNSVPRSHLDGRCAATRTGQFRPAKLCAAFPKQFGDLSLAIAISDASSHPLANPVASEVEFQHAISNGGKPPDSDITCTIGGDDPLEEPAVEQRAPRLAVPQHDASRTVPGSASSGLVEALRRSTRKVRFGQPTIWNVIDPHVEEILARGPAKLAQIEAALAANGITELKPLDAGLESIVLDAGDKVVRLTAGQRRQTPDIPEYNKPIAQGEIAGVRIEILPKRRSQNHDSRREGD